MNPIGKFAKLLLALTVAAAVVMTLGGCKKDEPTAQTVPGHAQQAAPGEPAEAAGQAQAQTAEPKRAEDGSQLVEITVTVEGYVPSPVTLKKGEPVTLKVTRTTERTCATEFILDEHNINEKLPVGQTVTIQFTPNEAGELRYGCHMDKMISGRFYVQ